MSLVNKAAVDYFFVELRLDAHFEALRHFLLMEDGEFAQSLSDLLFEKVAAGGGPWGVRRPGRALGPRADAWASPFQLGAGQTPGELLTPLVLNSALSKALQHSLHGDSPLAANLSFALKFLPEAFAPNAPDVLSCLELRYQVSRACRAGAAGSVPRARAEPASRQVDWPLNVVVTDSSLSRYSGIFSFLLQLRLMMWTLKDVCFHLKRTGEARLGPEHPLRARPVLTGPPPPPPAQRS